MTPRRVCQSLHFQQADLVKTSSKYINNMAIVGSASGKIVVELGIS